MRIIRSSLYVVSCAGLFTLMFNLYSAWRTAIVSSHQSLYTHLYADCKYCACCMHTVCGLHQQYRHTHAAPMASDGCCMKWWLMHTGGGLAG